MWYHTGEKTLFFLFWSCHCRSTGNTSKWLSCGSVFVCVWKQGSRGSLGWKRGKGEHLSFFFCSVPCTWSRFLKHLESLTVVLVLRSALPLRLQNQNPKDEKWKHSLTVWRVSNVQMSIHTRPRVSHCGHYLLICSTPMIPTLNTHTCTDVFVFVVSDLNNLELSWRMILVSD